MKVRRVDRMCGAIHFDPERKDGFLAIEDTDENGSPTGFLRVDARLTRTGVFEYADREGNSRSDLLRRCDRTSPVFEPVSTAVRSQMPKVEFESADRIFRFVVDDI